MNSVVVIDLGHSVSPTMAPFRSMAATTTTALKDSYFLCTVACWPFRCHTLNLVWLVENTVSSQKRNWAFFVISFTTHGRIYLRCFWYRSCCAAVRSMFHCSTRCLTLWRAYACRRRYIVMCWSGNSDRNAVSRRWSERRSIASKVAGWTSHCACSVVRVLLGRFSCRLRRLQACPSWGASTSHTSS